MKKIIGSVFFAILNMLILAEILNLAQRNIYNSSSFFPVKAFSILPMQGYEMAVSRSVLSSYKVHLGSYFGFQEVRSSHEEQGDELSFSITLPEGGLLDVFYQDNLKTRNGLRLSANKKISGTSFEIDGDYKFLNYNPVRELNISAGDYQGLLRQSDQGLDFFLDGNLVLKLPGRSLMPLFSFRGGLEDTIISEVTLKKSGQILWREDFIQEQLRFKNLKLAIVLVLAFTFIARVIRIPIGKFQIAFLSLLVLWFCFDFFYYSRLPVAWRGASTESFPRTFSYLNVEGLRSELFINLFQAFGEKTVPTRKTLLAKGIMMHGFDYSVCDQNGCRTVKDKNIESFPLKKKNEYRILMLGGSLFHGSGAFSVDKSIFAVIWKSVKKDLEAKNVVGLNLSKAGDSISEQLSLVETSAKDFDADLIIMGIMPREDTAELKKLESFFVETKKKNIAVINIKRPYNKDAHFEPGFQQTPMTDELMKKYGVTVVDLQSPFWEASLYETGILWWDRYHLTSYGHQLMAEFSMSAIRDSIRHQQHQGTFARDQDPAGDSPK